MSKDECFFVGAIIGGIVGVLICAYVTGNLFI